MAVLETVCYDGRPLLHVCKILTNDHSHHLNLEATLVKVPQSWEAALAALRSTTTGKSILDDPILSTVEVKEDPDLKAYGMAPSANCILVGVCELSVPQKACILAHELTHCHDLATAKLDKDKYLAEHGLARTELNAHMNQGRVLRELNTNPDYQDDINLFINGTTVWAKSATWHTREEVKTHLTSNSHYAKAMHAHTLRGQFIFEYEPFLVSRTRAFHCDANLQVNMAWQVVRGTVLDRKSVAHPKHGSVSVTERLARYGLTLQH